MAKKKVAKSSSTGMPAGLQAMKDLQRLLGSMNFNTIEEAEAFMRKVEQEGIPEFTPSGFEEEAEALVEQAHGLPAAKAVKQCRQALTMDPECIAAYYLLGQHEDLIPIRAALFKRGVDVGIERFDDAYMEANRGMFWGLHGTRPYMLCLAGYADALFELGKLSFALSVWLELLELDTNDALGVRQVALLCLATLCDPDTFHELDTRYEDDDMCGTLYNRALMEFHDVGGDRKKADSLLKAAIKRNPHVAHMLCSEQEPAVASQMYTPGSPEEAAGYVRYAWSTWLCVEGAVEWVQETQQPKLFKV
jgi:tetratricopeptide (TPR) repeat protein